MRRLGLLLLCLALMCGFTGAGICETEEYPNVFESKLYYRGELDSIIVSDDFVPGGAWHVDCPEDSTESYDSLQWAGIPFSLEERAPIMNEWIWGSHRASAWLAYFNDMYYFGGKAIQTDENGYSPFWDKLSFHGESIDPYTAPPNYDPDMDYWHEVRDLIGYAWYWYYFAYESEEYIKCSDRVWTWNGIEFEPEFPPPTYTDDDYDNDPHYIHMARGYLDLWEEYFNDLYYQSLSE